MTAILTLPGVLSSVPPGMEEGILLEPSGFVTRGLEALHLFKDGAGTVLHEERSGANGAIDNIASSNNAFSWLKRAIASLSIAAPGASGTNGTFALGFSGGSGSGAAGTFTVTGGQLTAVALTNGGQGYSDGAPPAVSFAASAGLAGAAVTVTLGESGGLQLSGAQLASFPAFDAAGAWTLFDAMRVVNHTGSAGVEKIAGLVGLRSFGNAQIRGGYLYQRGATNLSAAHANAWYQHRTANGSGGQAAAENVLPVNINTYGVGRLAAISYNGIDTLTSTVFDKNGAIIATASVATSDATLFTIGGVLASLQQWSVGGVTSTYAGGVVQHEAAARYSRALAGFSQTEILAVCEAAAQLAAARGRAW